MHILLLTAYFPPDVGSASHLFYELGQTFLERGHQVSVVTGFPSYHAQGDLAHFTGRWWLREPMDGMQVVRIHVPEVARNTPVGRGLWQFTCAAAFALAGLRLSRPDVTLVYSPPLPLGLTALAWRALRHIPFVINVQDLFPQSAIDLGLLRNRTLIRMFESLEVYLYRKANVITAHSEGNRAHILRRGGRPGSTFVMNNSVDVRHIAPGLRQNVLSHELGLDDSFVASFAGVMGYSQDLDVILDAAHLLRDDSTIRFLLVGEGVEKERLLSKCEALQLGNVLWLPMQSRDRYPLVLDTSDVCLTTLHAHVATPVVPSKILSAMAAARPVLAALNSDGDAPKLIAEAQAGYSLPPGDAPALAQALRGLASQPDLCQQLGSNGRRYAEAHLSPQAVAAAYESIFDQLAPRTHLIFQTQLETGKGHYEN